jgi:hypothetical protein
MLYFPQISQWKKGTYINLELIKMTDSVKETAERVLDECLDNDKNYTNAYIVYKKLIALEPEFFKKNKIENENHLYHVLKYYLGGTNKYLFTKPHILSVRAGVSDYKTEDLIFAVLGDREIFSKQELLVEVMKYYGIKNSSLALAMQKVLKSYVRVDGSRYYSRKKLKMSNKAIEKMDDFIEKNLIDGKYLVADKIYDFSGLPKMPFEWTSWSLCEVAKIYSKKFTVLSKKNNVMQNTMAIVPNGTFKTKEELAVYLVKNDYHGEDNEEEIVKYMKSLGLFSQGFSFSAIKEMLQS